MILETGEAPITVETLREKLEEVEQMREAITAGAVDAFVVGPADEQKRVLMLSGAYMRYRQLVEDMQQGAVTLTKDGEVLFANQSFAAMLGLSPLDLFRASLPDHVAAQDRPLLEVLLSPRGGQPAVELSLLGRDGARRARLSLVSASDDFITYLVTDLSRPLSPDEAAETLEAIRSGGVDALVVGGDRVVMVDSALKLYQAAVDRMQQGAVMLGEDRRIVYVNERFASLAATPRERILGSAPSRYVIAADRSRFQQALEACTDAASHVEVRIERSNGAPIEVAATLFSMPDGRCMCLFTDKSEHKRHVEADERNRKFLGMLAHEMRNMLSPIRSSATFLKGKPLEPQAMEAVEIIDRQSRQLAEMVEELRKINPR